MKWFDGDQVPLEIEMLSGRRDSQQDGEDGEESEGEGSDESDIEVESDSDSDSEGEVDDY